MDLYALTAVERRRLVDALEDVSASEWLGPSLCSQWSRHQVLAHLTSLWEVTPARLLLALVQRGSLDRALDDVTQHLARRLSPTECLDSLRTHASSRRSPPFLGPGAPLTDIIVHGADILWPLGRDWQPAVPALSESLTWIVTRSPRGFLPQGRLKGIRVLATDLGLALGPPEGEEIRGDALSLLTLIMGRTERADRVSGPGRRRLLNSSPD